MVDSSTNPTIVTRAVAPLYITLLWIFVVFGGLRYWFCNGLVTFSGFLWGVCYRQVEIHSAFY